MGGKPISALRTPAPLDEIDSAESRLHCCILSLSVCVLPREGVDYMQVCVSLMKMSERDTLEDHLSFYFVSEICMRSKWEPSPFTLLLPLPYDTIVILHKGSCSGKIHVRLEFCIEQLLLEAMNQPSLTSVGSLLRLWQGADFISI